MPIRNGKDQQSQRRALRNHGTAAEAVLWGYLNNRQILGMKFRRQESIGPYVVDFYCPECRLVIELDGASHYGVLGGERDAVRTRYLEEGRLTVIRFENRLIYQNIDAVLAAVRQAIAGNFF